MFERRQGVAYNTKKTLRDMLHWEGDGKLYQAMTYSIHNKLQNMALGNFQLMTRLESALDTIAGDVKYHGICFK